MSRTSSIIKNASNASHLGGVPRRLVLTTVGTIAKLVTSILNRTRVYNIDTLIDLVQSRPPGTPLLTVTNHMSTIDDPLMWGLKGLPMTDLKLCRWTLTAEDICFTNPLFSYIFRLGEKMLHKLLILVAKQVSNEASVSTVNECAAPVCKCIPIRRGAGIYQPFMNDALDVINRGDWLHTFPEGKLSQEEGPMRRLKWGVASLIARADVQPIVLPIAHNGFEKVFPEKFWFGKRPPLPLMMKHISIIVGEPMVFDIPQLRLTAKAMTAESLSGVSISNEATLSTHMESSILTHPRAGSENSNCLHLGSLHKTSGKQGLHKESSVVLDERTLNWMYAHMSETLRCVLQDLVLKAKSINKVYA